MFEHGANLLRIDAKEPCNKALNGGPAREVFHTAPTGGSACRQRPMRHSPSEACVPPQNCCPSSSSLPSPMRLRHRL